MGGCSVQVPGVFHIRAKPFITSDTCHVGTVWLPRKVSYLLLVNEFFKNSPSSAVLPPYLPPATLGYTPVSSLHSFPLYRRSILCTRIHDSYTYTSIPGTSRKSSDCSFPLDTPWNSILLPLAVFLPAYVHGRGTPPLPLFLSFSSRTALSGFLPLPASYLYRILSFYTLARILYCSESHTSW